MGTEPTLPLPGAGAPGQFPPPTDPWSAPTPPPSDPTRDPSSTGGTGGTPGAGINPGGEPFSDPGAGVTPYPMSQPQPTSGPPVAQSSAPPADPGPVVAQIGEIAVTSTSVHTPAGVIPLAGSTWQVSDFWQTEQRTPRWAIVVAIAGFCVLTVFSLLFLLVKESIHRGTVQVTVTNGPWHYVARIPVTAQNQVQHVHQQVNYVRALAAL